MSQSLTGTCLCASIHFTLPPTPPIKTMACYCHDCRKNSGGPYQTNAMYPASSVEISDTRSTLKSYTIHNTSSGSPKEKLFCGECGCMLFTKPGHYKGEMVVVKTGMLDGDGMERLGLQAELFTRDRPGFCRPLEGCKQIETMPGK
ncbi:hypothetical protein EX30DRAFT_337711 [Ascodesmis nigricans]|uniref:CENP-V/GFA domain-containing protein n=1 Tax=Ascodesmis nigricans TaxID=341454 RepID=A0A4S2N844_9PEZI|nr:hypothetical protein EX30DRAFT_337711 [Ascodesmis nigricans]